MFKPHQNIGVNWYNYILILYIYISKTIVYPEVYGICNSLSLSLYWYVSTSSHSPSLCTYIFPTSWASSIWSVFRNGCRQFPHVLLMKVHGTYLKEGSLFSPHGVWNPPSKRRWIIIWERYPKLSLFGYPKWPELVSSLGGVPKGLSNKCVSFFWEDVWVWKTTPAMDSLSNYSHFGVALYFGKPLTWGSMPQLKPA